MTREEALAEAKKKAEVAQFVIATLKANPYVEQAYPAQAVADILEYRRLLAEADADRRAGGGKGEQG